MEFAKHNLLFMKKIFHIIYSIIRRTTAYARHSSVHIRVLSIIIVCAVIVIALMYGMRQSDKTFDSEYAVYNDFALQADNAAYIPGRRLIPSVSLWTKISPKFWINRSTRLSVSRLRPKASPISKIPSVRSMPSVVAPTWLMHRSRRCRSTR